MKLRRKLKAFRSVLKEDWRRGASAVTCALLGLALLIGTDSRDWFYHASYDWLVRARSLLQSPPTIDDILIVSCDEQTIKVLGEDPIAKNDRARHAQLVRQLFERQALIVVFDILLDQSGEGDWEFAQAITNRSVVLAKSQRRSGGRGHPIITDTILPVEPIYSAAALHAGWVDFEPDTDGAVRRHPRDTESLGWQVAQLLNRTPPSVDAQRWINYYGKPGTIPHKSYYQVLETNFPSSLIRNKVVFVGSGPRITHYGSDSDQRPTPYGLMADGVEIQATVTRNLLHQEWVAEPSPGVETLVIAFWGILLGLISANIGVREMGGNPGVQQAPNIRLLRRTLWVSVLSAASVGLLAFLLFCLARLWLPWTIVGLAQIPWAAAWIVWIAVVPPKPHYDVFISYRRAGGAEIARFVEQELEAKGINVFVDVADLEAGKFDVALLRMIEATPSFVFIISRGAFDRCGDPEDWVRQEVSCALKNKKNIVPLLMEGSEMPKRDALPQDIAELVRYNAVPYSHMWATEAIEKLARRVRD